MHGMPLVHGGFPPIPVPSPLKKGPFALYLGREILLAAEIIEIHTGLESLLIDDVHKGKHRDGGDVEFLAENQAGIESGFGLLDLLIRRIDPLSNLLQLGTCP